MLLLLHRARVSQRGQTEQRSQRPECAGSTAGYSHIAGGDALPERQATTHGEIDNQHAEKDALAPTMRVECKGTQQHYPHDVGHGGPIVVRPFKLVVDYVGKGDPREVSATEESGQAPQGRAAHQVRGIFGRILLCNGIETRVFYLPVHFGGRLSRKAMIPSRASAVETSSSR